MSDTVGTFPHLRLSPEKETDIRASLAAIDHMDADAYIALITKNMNDPEVRDDMEHTGWHVDTNTPFDGSCSRGCLAREPREVIAELLEKRGLE